MRKPHTVLFAGAFFLLAASGGNAALITYADRAAFQAAAGGGLAFEGFNTDFPLSASQTFPVGGSTAFTVTTPVDIRSLASSSIVSEGARALSPREGVAVTFTFVNPIFAVGFDVNEFNNLVLSYSDSAGNAATALIAPGGVSFDGFFGAISDTAFTSFTLIGDAGLSQLYGIDALEFTAQSADVPVPATLALLGLGLASLGWSRRRK